MQNKKYIGVQIMLVRPCKLIYVLCVLCASVVQIQAQEFKTIKDGIEYAEVTREIGGLPVKMNLLRLDLKKVRLDVVHAMGAAIGTEKTSSIAARHGALAAINAGFFRLDMSIFAGDAAGILKIDGKFWSESNATRIAFGITNSDEKTEVSFGHIETKLTLYMGIDTSYSIAGINRERRENEILIFTPEFGRSTLTSSDGLEFLVKTPSKDRNTGNVTVGKRGEGSSSIPSDGYVISVSGDKQKELSYFFKKLMNLVSWNIVYNSLEKEKSKFFATADDIVGGVPQLIKNSKIDITWEQEKTTKSFVETRHPRTAVAKLKDGKFLMITVDGRSESSGGIGLYDLAAYLLELGATDAMNLDGGGSTTMFLDGKVVNHPSDKEGERKVSDAILVTLRRPAAPKK